MRLCFSGIIRKLLLTLILLKNAEEDEEEQENSHCHGGGPAFQALLREEKTQYTK